MSSRAENHPTHCQCALCKQYWEKHSSGMAEAKEQGTDIQMEVLQVEEWLEQCRQRIPILDHSKKEEQVEPDYTPDSLVSNRLERINQLVDAHWAYQEKLLTAGQDKTQTFTWHQVMEMRKWDYTSAAKHFYGHGYEDAVENQAELENRMEQFKVMMDKAGKHGSE